MRGLQRFSLAFLMALLVSTWANAALPQADGEGRPLPSLSKMLKGVNPAVVNIATFSEQQQTP